MFESVIKMPIFGEIFQFLTSLAEINEFLTIYLKLCPELRIFWLNTP